MSVNNTGDCTQGQGPALGETDAEAAAGNRRVLQNGRNLRSRVRWQEAVAVQEQQHVTLRGARPGVELQSASSFGFHQPEGRHRAYPFAGAVVAAAVDHNDLGRADDGCRFNDGRKANALVEHRNDDRNLHDWVRVSYPNGVRGGKEQTMSDSKVNYDIVILGGGSAGIVSGVMAGALGLRVLLIEKGNLGGECLNTGCVPSKALIHAARVARTIRTAGQTGIRVHDVTRQDMAGAMAYVRGTISQVQGADATETLLKDNGVEICRGDAKFIDSHTLQLGEAKVRANNFILATGSRPQTPDVPGLADVGYLTNQTLFELPTVPDRLLILGGGPVGVEMAQAFCRLGSRVTLVQRGPRLLPRDDAELTGLLTDLLRAEGVDVRLNASAASVEKQGDDVIVRIEQSGETDAVACDAVFVAAGRLPNTEGLALENAGVHFERKRVIVDERLRTSVPHIYACGDITGEQQFSHMAEYEAKIAVRNIVFPGQSSADRRLALWATFTDPELAHLGMTEEQAKASGLHYEVYRQPFAQNDRAIVDNAAQGMVKVIAQGVAGNILGVQILGPNAGELLHEWILAMQQGHSIRAIADMVHVYPTLSMACQHVAQRWYEAKAKEPWVAKLLNAYIRGIRPHQTAAGLGLLAATAAGVWLGTTRRKK